MPTQTILVIDDEVNLRVTLSAFLQNAGYKVTDVGHARDALARLAAGPFDLVFLDLRMPEMDGIELLGNIRELYPDMPVLILTAYATVDSAIDAVRLGAKDYLLKPVDPSVILARVKSTLLEQQASHRRREIVGQIQELLAELQQLDGAELNAVPANLMAAVPPTASARFLKQGDFTMDLHARHALLQGRLLPLPPSAFDYLVTLLRHAPEAVSPEVLVMQSQGYYVTRSEAQAMVRWRIHQLRQAVEADPSQPRYLLTERGVGYRLVSHVS
jgi:DNA-binding response OmpR family regulator